MPTRANCTGSDCQTNYYGVPNCATPLEPTLPDEFRTWNIGNPSSYGDWTRYHPWRSPGRAPLSDPCGIAGGYAVETGGGGETPVGAPRQGFPGSQLPKLENVTVQWAAGGVAEVGWMLGANHGGGYHYSLCPAGQNITEECLNANPLSYVGNTTTVRYIAGPLRGSERSIPATDVSVGTFPAGSVWRRNPVPSCNCDHGFTCAVGGSNYQGQVAYENGSMPVPAGYDCPTGTQFEVPFPYGYGQQLWNQGTNVADPKAMNTWVLVDRVQVPPSRGDFVLRWRWDTEQNPQVWTHCADISIV
jgi:hypothetical protein